MNRILLLSLFIGLFSPLAVKAQPNQFAWSDTLATLEQARMNQINYAPYVPVDTLINKNHFRQVQTDNQLLKTQNQQLKNSTGGRWFLLIMVLLAGAVETAIH